MPQRWWEIVHTRHPLHVPWESHFSDHRWMQQYSPGPSVAPQFGPRFQDLTGAVKERAETMAPALTSASKILVVINFLLADRRLCFKFSLPFLFHKVLDIWVQKTQNTESIIECDNYSFPEWGEDRTVMDIATSPWVGAPMDKYHNGIRAFQ